MTFNTPEVSNYLPYYRKKYYEPCIFGNQCKYSYIVSFESGSDISKLEVANSLPL